ncbi:hypothetical protein AB9T88_03165 [Flavobacterium sp. LBUM151]
MINTLAFFILFLSREAKGQTNNDMVKMDLLKNEILKMDSLLFDVAFNQCDASLFKKIIAEDLEFYDDRFGLNTSKGNEIKSLTEKCASAEKLQNHQYIDRNYLVRFLPNHDLRLCPK